MKQKHIDFFIFYATHKKASSLKRENILDDFIFFESNSILLPHPTSNLYQFPIHLIFSPFISDFNGKIKYTQKIPFVLSLYTTSRIQRENEV